VPFDQLATLFPLSASPKSRSPAARTSSNLAFLDEISQEGFKSYTPVQVSTILKQRNQVSSKTLLFLEPVGAHRINIIARYMELILLFTGCLSGKFSTNKCVAPGRRERK
jgi:hypothetical protein